MTKKFVVKTTKEYTYDDKGFIVKEVVTEESYETDLLKAESFIMKAVGVPNSGTVTNPPWTKTTISYDTVKVDTNNIKYE